MRVWVPRPAEKRHKYVSAMKSWSPWFRDRVSARRLILSQHLHNAWAMKLSDWCISLPVELPLVDRHADYLNGDAIAYRQAIGTETVNGFYVS